MSIHATTREEELKNRVATLYFGKYDCTRIVGNIDFCVLPKRRDPRQMTFIHDAPILWAEAKNHPTDVCRMLAQLILTIKGELKGDVEPPRSPRKSRSSPARTRSCLRTRSAICLSRRPPLTTIFSIRATTCSTPPCRWRRTTQMCLPPTWSIRLGQMCRLRTERPIGLRFSRQTTSALRSPGADDSQGFRTQSTAIQRLRMCCPTRRCMALAERGPNRNSSKERLSGMR